MFDCEVMCCIKGYVALEEGQNWGEVFNSLDCGVLENIEMVGKQNSSLAVKGYYTMHIPARSEAEALRIAPSRFDKDMASGKVGCGDLQYTELMPDKKGTFKCVAAHRVPDKNEPER